MAQGVIKCQAERIDLRLWDMVDISFPSCLGLTRNVLTRTMLKCGVHVAGFGLG
jgi:hypothetical protein